MNIIDMTENQAKEILDFLAKRYSKKLEFHLCSHIDYDRYYLDTTTYYSNVIIRYYYHNDYWPVNICIKPIDNMGKCINFAITSKQMSIKEFLDILFNMCSKGYAIVSTDLGHLAFMHPFETLESILIEKDLEESIS